MNCSGRCDITEYEYDENTIRVTNVEPSKSNPNNCPEIKTDDPRALDVLRKTLNDEPVEARTSCKAGCDCIRNTVQTKVPKDKEKITKNVPYEEYDVRLEAPLVIGNCAYTVKGSTIIKSRILEGHCTPGLLTSSKVQFQIPNQNITVAIEGMRTISSEQLSRIRTALEPDFTA